ncbi:MAG: hypothetical protein A2Y76_02565 [Planctomycetes bacterium RBG_13_60_9]|nr:MAG: hypothetical protein A2Y76_02565 [Planctomycetes bacterium RBG_13_60_9]
MMTYEDTMALHTPPSYLGLFIRYYRTRLPPLQAFFRTKTQRHLRPEDLQGNERPIEDSSNVIPAKAERALCHCERSEAISHLRD